MLERDYQHEIITILRNMFPGCIVLKNDSSYLQGIPDLLVLFEDKWAALEVKLSASAREQTNQVYYVEMMNQMSFAAFIYPENEREVLDALQYAFKSGRTARFPRRE